MALFNKESPPYGPVLRGTSPFLLVLTSYKGLTALFLKCLQGQLVVLKLTRPTRIPAPPPLGVPVLLCFLGNFLPVGVGLSQSHGYTCFSGGLGQTLGGRGTRWEVTFQNTCGW